MTRTSIFIFIALIVLMSTCYYLVNRVNDKILDVAEKDFKIDYPNGKIVDLGFGDADVVVVEVILNFNLPKDTIVHQKVWKYWDVDSTWVREDKYKALRVN